MSIQQGSKNEFDWLNNLKSKQNKLQTYNKIFLEQMEKFIKISEEKTKDCLDRFNIYIDHESVASQEFFYDKRYEIEEDLRILTNGVIRLSNSLSKRLTRDTKVMKILKKKNNSQGKEKDESSVQTNESLFKQELLRKKIKRDPGNSDLSTSQGLHIIKSDENSTIKKNRNNNSDYININSPIDYHLWTPEKFSYSSNIDKKFINSVNRKLKYVKLENDCISKILPELYDHPVKTKNNWHYILLKFYEKSYEIYTRLPKFFEGFMMKLGKEGEESLIGGKTKNLNGLIDKLNEIYGKNKISLLFEFYIFIEDVYINFSYESNKKEYNISENMKINIRKFKEFREKNKL